jgi:hypothetical protein
MASGTPSPSDPVFAAGSTAASRINESEGTISGKRELTTHFGKRAFTEVDIKTKTTLTASAGRVALAALASPISITGKLFKRNFSALPKKHQIRKGDTLRALKGAGKVMATTALVASGVGILAFIRKDVRETLFKGDPENVIETTTAELPPLEAAQVTAREERATRREAGFDYMNPEAAAKELDRVGKGEGKEVVLTGKGDASIVVVGGREKNSVESIEKAKNAKKLCALLKEIIAKKGDATTIASIRETAKNLGFEKEIPEAFTPETCNQMAELINQNLRHFDENSLTMRASEDTPHWPLDEASEAFEKHSKEYCPTKGEDVLSFRISAYKDGKWTKSDGPQKEVFAKLLSTCREEIITEGREWLRKKFKNDPKLFAKKELEYIQSQVKFAEVLSNATTTNLLNQLGVSSLEEANLLIEEKLGIPCNLNDANCSERLDMLRPVMEQLLGGGPNTEKGVEDLFSGSDVDVMLRHGIEVRKHPTASLLGSIKDILTNSEVTFPVTVDGVEFNDLTVDNYEDVLFEVLKTTKNTMIRDALLEDSIEKICRKLGIENFNPETDLELAPTKEDYILLNAKLTVQYGAGPYKTQDTNGIQNAKEFLIANMRTIRKKDGLRKEILFLEDVVKGERGSPAKYLERMQPFIDKFVPQYITMNAQGEIKIMTDIGFDPVSGKLTTKPLSFGWYSSGIIWKSKHEKIIKNILSDYNARYGKAPKGEGAPPPPPKSES